MLLTQKFLNQVVSVDLVQGVPYPGFVLLLIPEKEAMLLILFFFGLGHKNLFEGIGMVTTVINDGCHRHGCRCESLYLLQFETHVLGLRCKIGHVFYLARGMIGYEIRYELQVQLLFDIDLVKTLLELVKVGE